MHDEQSAEFVERGAHAAEVRRIVDRIERGLVRLSGAIHGFFFRRRSRASARLGAGQTVGNDFCRADRFFR